MQLFVKINELCVVKINELCVRHKPVLDARSSPGLIVGHYELNPRVFFVAVLLLHRLLEIRVGRANEPIEAAKEDVRRAVDERLSITFIEVLGVGVALWLIDAVRVAFAHLFETAGSLVNTLSDLLEQVRSC